MTEPSQPRDRDQAIDARWLAAAYEELHRATRLALAEPADSPVRAGEIVAAAWDGLRARPGSTEADRRRFRALAPGALRQILVDSATASATDRAERWPTRTLLATTVAGTGNAVDVTALHHALDRLDGLDARTAEVVELRVFGGLTDDEIASIVGTTAADVEQGLNWGRAWLGRELAVLERGDSG